MGSSKLTRRRFIGSATAAASMVMLPPAMQAALAKPAPRNASLDDVEHVIFLMQENRSFDSIYGTLSGVSGFDDPNARGRKGQNVFYQPDPENPDGYVLPFHFDTFNTSAACVRSVSHAWDALHWSWNNGKMDGFVTAHRTKNGDRGPLTMGYYERKDVPFHYALADAFTICDRYFCSVMGPTQPNRLYAQTGTIDPDGNDGGPDVYNGRPDQPFTWTTYPEALQKAGVSWRMYWETFGDTLNKFKNFQEAPVGSPLYENGIKQHGLDDFANDVAAGNLPQMSWLTAPSKDDEHPGRHPVANGAVYIYNVLQILASHPEVWSKTVLFLTWDENDGFYDHVTPPTPPPGTPGEYLTVSPLPEQAGGIAGPIGLGFRVGTIVISPWSQGGWVSSEVFDHTSVLRFVETRFGVEVPNVSEWRRQTVGDMTSTLRLNQKVISFPRFESPEPVQKRQEENCATKPEPTVPQNQSMPHQEKGGRKHLPPHPHPPHYS